MGERIVYGRYRRESGHWKAGSEAQNLGDGIIRKGFKVVTETGKKKGKVSHEDEKYKEKKGGGYVPEGKARLAVEDENSR